jgi:hypothetical protein
MSSPSSQKKIDSARFFMMIVTSILAAYILYQVWSKMLPTSPAQKLLEGFTYKERVTISSAISGQTQMPLVNYCIKASYNSAYDGSKITIDALDNVMKRGCRFLDFEIYNAAGVPVVGVGVDPEYKSLISSNTLPFQEIMTRIYNSAFLASWIPNPRDPLFIHLRIKTKCDASRTANCAIYSKIAEILNVSGYQYVDANEDASPVTGDTTLTSIMQKIVICIDMGLSPNYDDYSPELKSLINIETNTTDYKVYEYSDFTTMTPNILTNVADYPMMADPQTGSLSLTMAIPDKNKQTVNNPASPLSWIRNFGCQTIFYQYWLPPGDAADKQYEDIFNQFNTAFVPIGFVVNKYNSCGSD